MGVDRRITPPNADDSVPHEAAEDDAVGPIAVMRRPNRPDQQRHCIPLAVAARPTPERREDDVGQLMGLDPALAAVAHRVRVREPLVRFPPIVRQVLWDEPLAEPPSPHRRLERGRVPIDRAGGESPSRSQLLSVRRPTCRRARRRRCAEAATLPRRTPWAVAGRREAVERGREARGRVAGLDAIGLDAEPGARAICAHHVAAPPRTPRGDGPISSGETRAGPRLRGGDLAITARRQEAEPLTQHLEAQEQRHRRLVAPRIRRAARRWRGRARSVPIRGDHGVSATESRAAGHRGPLGLHHLNTRWGNRPGKLPRAARPSRPRRDTTAHQGESRRRHSPRPAAGSARGPIRPGRPHHCSTAPSRCAVARWGNRPGKLPRAARPSRPRRGISAHQGESRRRFCPHPAAGGARRPVGLSRPDCCSTAPGRRAAAKWGIRPGRPQHAARPSRPRRVSGALAALARGPPPRADVAQGRASTPRRVLFVIEVDDQNLCQNFGKRGIRPGRPPRAARHSLWRWTSAALPAHDQLSPSWRRLLPASGADAAPARGATGSTSMSART